MTVPDYETLMLPLLKFAADGEEHNFRDVIEYLSNQFNLTEQERRALIPSGQRRIIVNRAGWARTYLKKAVLLEYPRRGYIKITARGLNVLAQAPPKIDVKYLALFPEFLTFKSHRQDVPKPSAATEVEYKRTPDELLEAGYDQIRANLAQDVLGSVKNCSSHFFEKVVVELLQEMGYGGPHAGEVVGKPGDEGVDGVIKEDKLGLDLIYIQAKKWEATVGRPEIQRFVGALHGKRAKKGIFITTSDFSEEAKEFVKSIDPKVVLIDGEDLAELMIDHDVGVSRERTYEVKKLDSDYFSEE